MDNKTQLCIMCNESDSEENLHTISKSSTYETLSEDAQKLKILELIERITEIREWKIS